MADTQLYEALSVRRSFGRSVRIRDLVKKWEYEFQKLFVFVSVLERGLGEVLGVDEGWLPLPTRPQRYGDPASLVFE